MINRRQVPDLSYSVLVAIRDKENENTPFRIELAARMNTEKFRKLISLLQERGMVHIEHNARSTGSRNKFFVTEKGLVFMANYQKALAILGVLDGEGQPRKSLSL